MGSTQLMSTIQSGFSSHIPPVLTQSPESASSTDATMPSWMSWDGSAYAPTPNSEAEETLAERRARNRDSMRRARQNKRSELQQMKDTVASLKKQYEALGIRVTSEPEQQVQDDENLSVTTRRLGAENLQLKESIQDEAGWQTHVRRILDADDGWAVSTLELRRWSLRSRAGHSASAAS